MIVHVWVLMQPRLSLRGSSKPASSTLMQMPAGVEGMCAFNDLRFSTLECYYILKWGKELGKIFFPLQQNIIQSS
jgi:hypothetical protein